ncbi:MAG: SDR family NAD(P)-dependent oxidoreductase [Chthoniobacteraceae bacterium]|nr:SDR family NAD(P)-dependent oxidoreductase [Chthoniobacteraceae bacterium]
MDLDLQHKTVFVTGASSGIGLAAVELFAKEGCFVIAGYRSNAEAAEALISKIRAGSGDGMAVHIDLESPKSIRECVAAIVERTGSIYSVIFNAGANKLTAFDEIQEEEWDSIMAVNLKGPFFLMQAIAPHITPGGSAVFVSSIAGQMGAPGHVHYAVSKGGIISLTKSAAKRYASNIRVNCVAPGVTLTPMGENAVKDADPDYAKRMLLSRRFAEPAEVAKVIVFLASPAASFIYGATIDVNGGRELR